VVRVAVHGIHELVVQCDFNRPHDPPPLFS
jgi:hypothetical protein